MVMLSSRGIAEPEQWQLWNAVGVPTVVGLLTQGAVATATDPGLWNATASQ
jgi:hypothetical protein